MNIEPRQGETFYTVRQVEQGGEILLHEGDSIKIMGVYPDEGIVGYERKGKAGGYVYELTNLSTFHNRFKRPFEA